jgi:hypothetical protein
MSQEHSDVKRLVMSKFLGQLQATQFGALSKVATEVRSNGKMVAFSPAETKVASTLLNHEVKLYSGEYFALCGLGKRVSFLLVSASARVTKTLHSIRLLTVV